MNCYIRPATPATATGQSCGRGQASSVTWELGSGSGKRIAMTTMTSTPENHNDIRAGIVELLKAARSAAGRRVTSIP